MNIAVVTTARSDYGIYRPLLQRLRADDRYSLNIIAAASHLSARFGMTVRDIEHDGFTVAARVPCVSEGDDARAIALAAGEAALGFARAYDALAPDLVFVLGDRYEMHAAASAAVPFRIPLAHIGGGDVTRGAIDEQYRHSISKLAHLHYVTNELAARRVLQMGEEPWRVVNAGNPSLDALRDLTLVERQRLMDKYRFEAGLLLVTYHPVTLERDVASGEFDALLDALSQFEHAIIATHPGADEGNRAIIDKWQRLAQSRPGVRLVESLGTLEYFSLMAVADAMVGNSSSGLVEAASFGLPVVNVGVRQAGRLKPDNVIDVSGPSGTIAAAIRRALEPGFKESLAGKTNPYGDGAASERILRSLAALPGRAELLRKQFVSGGSAETERS